MSRMRSKTSGSIDGRPISLYRGRSCSRNRSKIDVTIDGAQQMIRGDPIVETEILEHRGRL
jgi:hypothetical protein